MKVSTRGDYAARALLSLALHGSEQPTSVKEIAERTTLPQPYLEQILLAVKGAGLVRSKRGVGGGYVLARPAEEITLAVETDRSPIELPAAKFGPLEQQIARHVAALIPDRATLQMGIGAVPEAIVAMLGDRRDLGVHSGMVGDSVVDLMERGAVTNAHKGIDPGVTVTGVLFGTQRLYRFAHENPQLRLCHTRYTHAAGTLAKVRGLVSINSALEVDLTGQVNAEQTGSEYLGGTGGQVDFVRAGMRSPGGHAIIALPATARGGTVSRITARLTGPVTTARSEVDVIVTEFGAAELKGQSLAERARRLAAIAHPGFRESLEHEARAIAQRGF